MIDPRPLDWASRNWSLGESTMIYITQGRYTQSAMKGMIANPEDRSEQARALFERAGLRMLSYYVTFGEYDFLIVNEGDMDLQSYMAAAVTAAASGGVSDLKTTMGMPAADMKGACEKAAATAAQYRAVGQG
jgi:uncharacterized protein with GYD domain